MAWTLRRRTPALFRAREDAKKMERFFFPDDRPHWWDKCSLLSFLPYPDPTWIAPSQRSLPWGPAGQMQQPELFNITQRALRAGFPLLATPWLWTKCICSTQSLPLRLPHALKKPLQYLYNFRKQLYSNLKKGKKCETNKTCFPQINNYLTKLSSLRCHQEFTN